MEAGGVLHPGDVLLGEGDERRGGAEDNAEAPETFYVFPEELAALPLPETPGYFNLRYLG